MSIMVVGFSLTHLRTFEDLGRNVRVCFYSGAEISEEAQSEFDHVTFISVDERWRMKPSAFRPDLRQDVAARVREVAYHPFQRCHVREFFRQMGFRQSWVDYNNHFENSLQFYYGLIKDNEIDTVVFAIPPHEGAHVVLYAVAHALGVRVVMCHQSIFRGGFHIFETFPELGRSSVTNDHKLEIVLNRQPESPFYTKTLRNKISHLEFARRIGVAGVKLTGRTIALQPIWNKRSYAKAVLKIRELISFHRMQNLPDRYYDTFERADKYIYISLHMQPELATDLLGGRYADQLLLVEELARALPDDVVIYAKEHPQQKMNFRDPSYFDRLKQIPRVRYLRPETSPFDLIAGSRAVVAISGTVGWEALQMGKPVLCFGAGWYRDFPGVFDWRDGPEEAIARAFAFEPDFDALQDAADGQARTLWKGLVNTVFAQLLDSFDPLENARDVARSVDEYLTKAPPIEAEGRLRAAFLD